MPKSVLFYLLIVITLLVSALNINTYLKPNRVLGAETQEVDSRDVFWQNFVSKNPNYIPGWIEIGRMDKVREIDPNYIMP